MTNFRLCRAPGCVSALLVGAWLSVWSSPAQQTSPTALKQLTLEELSEIEVTSPSKEPERASAIPMAIFVISSEDIRRSGATSIPQVLRLAPGVEVSRIEGSKWSVAIRGFGSRLSRSVLVLIDGRSVYTTFFAGTYWEVQDTVLDDIERIEVIRGPGGTIWGPNAVNGVINIITKKARDTQGMLATAITGFDEQGLLQFRYGGGNGRSLHYRVYGKAFTRGPQVHQDGRNYDDWRSAQSGFRFEWEQDERTSLTVQGDLYAQEAGQRVTLINYTAPYSQVVEQNADLGGGNLLARWDHSLAGGSHVQVQAYYDRTNRLEANFEESRDTYDIDFLVRHAAGSRHQLSWGAGARASRGAATQRTTGLTFDPLRRTDYLLTGFLQDEIALVPDRLAITLGTKLLRTNFAAFELEPSARLLWTPAKRHTFWASVTHAVRTPSRVERDFSLSGYINTTADGTPFFARFDANRDFATEQLNAYELGYRRLITANLFIDTAAFYNRYHDLFSQEITGAPFLESTPAPAHLLLPAQFRNGLLGATSGYEIAPEWRPAKWWRLRGAYSYLAMDLKKAPGSLDFGTAATIERSSPRHQVVIQSAFDLPKRFEADLAFRSVSALPGQGVPRYSTGDARVGWRISSEVDMSVVGRNLFQPSHVEFANEVGPPVGLRRRVYVRLAWTH